MLGGDGPKLQNGTFDSRNVPVIDRKSTRLNSSHHFISYAVFCLKKKIIRTKHRQAASSGQILLPRAETVRPHLTVAMCAVSVSSQLVLPFVLYFFFFFLKDRAPPESSPFPLPAPFRI